MRGMYLHAERLLAKAGRQGATRRGIAHPKGKRSAVIFRRKIMGRPLAPRQGSALSEVWFPYSRALARHIAGAALRAGHRPARGRERKTQSGCSGEEASSLHAACRLE